MALSAERTDQLIRECLDSGWGVRRTAKRFGVGVGRVIDIRDGHTLNHRMGRPQKLTQEVISFIETHLLLDATITDERMAEMVNARFDFGDAPVHRRMICDVRRKLKIIYRPPFKVQDLKPEHEAARMTFVTMMLDWIRFGLIRNLIFSDESRFCRGPDCLWVRVRRGAWNDTATVTQQKFPLGVMVFGAIGRRFKSRLIRCSRGVDSAEYVRMVLACGLPEVPDQLWGVGNWHFMQDGAPCHTAESTMLQLQRYMRVLEIWPANSPDLNPIEMLWSIIARKLVTANVRTEDEMFAEVERVWNELDQDMIDRLVDSFERRCQWCSICRGKTISQLLSSHIKAPRPQDIGTAEASLFPPELDDRLLEVVAEAKNRASWKKISQLPEFAGHNPSIIKQRWQFLTYRARNDEWQEIRAQLGLVDEDEVDVDAFDGIAPEEVPDDEEEEEGEDVGEGQVDVGDSSSSDDEPSPRPSPARTTMGPSRAYIVFSAARSKDRELGELPAAERARRLGALWRQLPEAEKAEWAAQAPSATPREAPKKRSRGRPKKA